MQLCIHSSALAVGAKLLVAALRILLMRQQATAATTVQAR
jgi:hypothetical protein